MFIYLGILGISALIFLTTKKCAENNEKGFRSIGSRSGPKISINISIFASNCKLKEGSKSQLIPPQGQLADILLPCVIFYQLVLGDQICQTLTQADIETHIQGEEQFVV